MKLTDLNRAGGIGSNSLLLQLGDLRILVDCGLHPKVPGRQGTPDLVALRGKRLDLIILTHCHLDHLGSLPVVMREHPDTPVVMTQPSRMLAERMLHNSANVMLRQRDEDNIKDYPLFTHEEIERVARGGKYILMDGYRNEQEKVNLLYWQLTCECFFTPAEWEWVFAKCGYTGDYGCIFFE